MLMLPGWTPLPRPWRGDTLVTLVPAHNLREFDGMRDLYLEFGPNWVAPMLLITSHWLQNSKQDKFRFSNTKVWILLPVFSFLQYAMRVIFQASYKRYWINIEECSGGLPGHLELRLSTAQTQENRGGFNLICGLSNYCPRTRSELYLQAFSFSAVVALEKFSEDLL